MLGRSAKPNFIPCADFMAVEQSMSYRKQGSRRRFAFCSALLLAAAPVAAQDAPPGQTANSSVGQVGQRQTREKAAATIAPTARIASRIVNRVQSRIRNRIDRYYDPKANAASPFEVAGEQARIAGRQRRR